MTHRDFFEFIDFAFIAMVEGNNRAVEHWLRQARLAAAVIDDDMPARSRQMRVWPMLKAA